MKSLNISPGITVFTKDLLAPGSDETVRSIVYDVQNDKRKILVFQIDFTGSTNLRVRNAKAGMKMKVRVPPMSKKNVAIVDVIDERLAWGLETRYSFFEENVGSLEPGEKRTEELQPGVKLQTFRENDFTFTYSLEIEKNTAVTITLDASKSENIELKGHAGLKATIQCPPFSQVLIGSLTIKNPNAYYKLQTKFSYFESIGNSTTAIMYHIPENEKTAMADSSPPSKKASSSSSTNYNATTTSEPNKLVKNQEEISPSVFLTIESEFEKGKKEIAYFVEVLKNTRVFFEADFRGSINIVVAENAVDKLMSAAECPPFKKTQVARLKCLDEGGMPFKVSCRYKWEEEDLVVSPSLAAAPPSTENASPNRKKKNELRDFLASLHLENLLTVFEQEDISMDLLRVMARDEAEFRKSLIELGINKIGTREKILYAVKTSL